VKLDTIKDWVSKAQIKIWLVARFRRTHSDVAVGAQDVGASASSQKLVQAEADRQPACCRSDRKGV